MTGRGVTSDGKFEHGVSLMRTGPLVAEELSLL